VLNILRKSYDFELFREIGIWSQLNYFIKKSKKISDNFADHEAVI